MKNSWLKLPENWRVLIPRLGILLLSMQVTRLIFYVFNQSGFRELGISDWLAGFWFDSITLCLLGFPYLVLALLPLPFTGWRIYQGFMRILFYVLLLIFSAANLMDVVYYSFTQKRSTVDLFSIITAGEDLAQQMGSFFRDFWLLAVMLIAILLIVWLFERRIKHRGTQVRYLPDGLLFLVSVALFVLIGRGGFGLKPVNPIDASRFTRIENTALVLNTPFTLIKSMDQGGIEERHYLDTVSERKLFNPVKKTLPAQILPNGTNVVLILLESFGAEWVGASGAKESFTPFLDSLADQSLYFVNGLANGKKSIEAIPCIVASLPALMDNPYISSPYANNKTQSLASILASKGYETGFFHGATNGSMRFDGYAAQAGFQHYMGRKEYNNDKHFDQSWGILDEYFNPWTARELTKYKKPFFATLFTLSSHHPYYIPPHMRGKLKQGPLPICQSIHYGDYSLKRFFEQAKREPWYKNTIFIICADHTSASSSELYNQRTEIYKIPMLIFDPQARIKAKRETAIFQQMDIMPTVLDLLNIQSSYYAYGNSYYQKTPREAITYIEGTYHYFTNRHLLTFSGDKVRNLYNIQTRTENTPDSLRWFPQEVKKNERILKAMIQRYHRDLIRNQTHIP